MPDGVFLRSGLASEGSFEDEVEFEYLRWGTMERQSQFDIFLMVVGWSFAMNVFDWRCCAGLSGWPCGKHEDTCKVDGCICVGVIKFCWMV